MASTYYDSSGKEVVDGNVAYATDLNDINSAIDTAFQQVETDITTVSSNQSYYADLAEKWAENPEDTAVVPGQYSALHWAAKAADDKVLTAADVVQTNLDKVATAADRVNTNNDKIATAADRVQTGLDRVATAADRVQTGLDVVSAAGSASDASDSADAAAAVVAQFPTLGAGDQGKYLRVKNPYTGGYEAATVDLSSYAPLASPALTGNPTAPTQSSGNNSTRIATTAFTLANSERNRVIVSGLALAENILGGDVTVSSNTLTITKTSCLADDYLTPLSTTGDSSVVLPSTINQDFYVFIVRLVSDGSCTMKAYTTYAGPSSDVLVDKWRWLSYAKNNASGVTMPYRQTGDRLDWLLSQNRPILAATLTTTYTGYALSAILPVALLNTITLGQTETVVSSTYIAYDSSTTNPPYRTDNYNNTTEILSVATIYIKYAAASTFMHIAAITLRR